MTISYTTIAILLIAMLGGIVALALRLHHRHTDTRTFIAEIIIGIASLFLLMSVLVSESLAGFVIRALLFFLFAVTSIFLIRNIIRERRTALEITDLYSKLRRQNRDLQQAVEKNKRTNKELKQLIEAKSEFLQIASHQLRTPLTGLRGMLGMLADGQMDDLPVEKRRRTYKQLYVVANNMHKIVNDLLNTMRLDDNRIKFTFEPIQIEDLLQEVIDVFEPAYKDKGIKLTFAKPAKPLPKIEADWEYISQVFLNIVDNAYKYTEKGGATISAKHDAKKDEVHITISDTGRGIEPKELNHICNKFMRGEDAVSKKKDGSGLGLYIVQKIVASHQGCVVVESEGIGKGAALTVQLPVRQKKAGS